MRLGGWEYRITILPRSASQERGYVGVSRARQHSIIVADYDSLGVPDDDRAAALAVLAHAARTAAVRWRR